MSSQTPEKTNTVQRAESLSCKVAKPRPDVSDLKKKKCIGRKRQHILDSLRPLSSEMQLTKSNRSATTLSSYGTRWVLLTGDWGLPCHLRAIPALEHCVLTSLGQKSKCGADREATGHSSRILLHRCESQGFLFFQFLLSAAPDYSQTDLSGSSTCQVSRR